MLRHRWGRHPFHVSFFYHGYTSLPMSDKKAIRQQYREKRLSLPAYRQQLASYSIGDKILRKVSAIKHAESIAFYIANDGEIDLFPLMLHCLKHGRRCYLPVLKGPDEKKLGFAEWAPGKIMSRNKYGIAEPLVPHHHLLTADELDLIFMPLVAFDDTGNRLGMGGGYYDRTLAEFCHGKTHRAVRKPFLVATGHNIQHSRQLPRDKWDVTPDITITPGFFIRPLRVIN